MYRLLAALVLVSALAAPAAAAPDPFEAFVGALAGDPKAVAARLKACDLILLPSGEARTPCTLSAADLGVPGATLKAKHVKHDQLTDSLVEYLEADVDAQSGGKTVASFHVVEVGSSMNQDAVFVPFAAHWARTVSDAAATKLAKAGKLPKAAAITARVVSLAKDAGDQEKGDHDEGVHELHEWLTGGDLKDGLAGIAASGVVYGSASGQRYAGKSAAKQIKGWKLGLLATGDAVVAGSDTVVYGATDVVGTLPDKTSITYAALVVYSSRMIAQSGDRVWEPRIVSFAVPQ